MSEKLPPESSAVEEISNEIGISVATLERWRAEFLARASGVQPHRWTLAARLEAVIATAGLDAVARAAWCREHGLFPTALDAWQRDAIAGLGEQGEESLTTRQDNRRVKELERELGRKDKALAETAALRVLSKNSRRSSTTARTHDPPGRSHDPDRAHHRGPCWWRAWREPARLPGSTRASSSAGASTMARHAVIRGRTRSGQHLRTR